MKLFSSTALALAVILASTGCRHKPTVVTPIPRGPGTGITDYNNPNTISNGQPLDNTGGGAQGIPLSGSWDPSMMNADHQALAAYTIHFKYDSAVVKDSDMASLQSVASALQSDPNAKLLIEGNCDERGTEEYNRSLGERRALAAREALAKLGLDPQRVRTISYGKDQPADPGHDESAWSKNRRDDFVLLHPK